MERALSKIKKCNPLSAARSCIVSTGSARRRVPTRQLRHSRFQESGAGNRDAGLYDAAPVAYFVFDLKGIVQEVNPAGCQLLKESYSQVAGKTFSSYLASEDQKLFLSQFKRMKKSEKKASEFRLRLGGGEVLWIKMITRTIRKRDGEISLFASVLLDVSAQKRTENNISHNGKRTRLIIETAKDAFFEVDTNEKITDWNRQAEMMFGWSRKEVMGRSLYGIILPANQRERYERDFKKFRRAGGGDLVTKPIELNLHHRKGHEFPAELTVWPIYTPQGCLLNAFVRDISERKKVELEVLNISLREQQRLGQDLHDSISQELTGTAFLIKVLEQNLAKADSPYVADVRRILDLLHDSIAQTRNLARGLLAWELETNGLAVALTELGSSMARIFNIRCLIKCDSNIHLVENPIILKHLYRIAQEAMGNAARHGKAQKVQVELFYRNLQVILRVIDNGTDFDSSLDYKDGMGLRIMKYRASLIGAMLKIQKGKGGGTVVQCALPYPSKP